MRVTVLIPTYNRAACLPNTLDALRHQTHDDFEVIVIKGPCTDNTDEVLEPYRGTLRVYESSILNLNIQRNIGIRHAAGEVIALIDDDSIPDPRWLEDLVAGYNHPSIGGVGGLVYNHTGYQLQYRYAVCDRRANARWDISGPLTPYQFEGADPFVYLQGTNCSYRRSALEKIGGFDEEIEYYLDETELCMQMADAGLPLRPLDRAIVHHKFMPSHLRNEKKVLSRPFLVMKNKAYFCMRNARGTGNLTAALKDCEAFADGLRAEARGHQAGGRLTESDMVKFEKELLEGMRTGIDRGLTQQRKCATFPPIDPTKFVKYPTLKPDGKQLGVCFVSMEFAPYTVGGIGRYTKDMAEGLAARGHEVHVVTKSPDEPRVDFESGVWVHRVPPLVDGDWARPGQSPSVRRCLSWAAAAHAEVVRLSEFSPLDVVACPNWDSEGIYCLLDDRFVSLLTISTTLKTVRDIDATHRHAVGIESLVDLEAAMVAAARHVATPSGVMLAKARRDFPMTDGLRNGYVMHHGIPDAVGAEPAKKADGRVRVVTVGRLEKRKGTDLLLKAAVKLLPDHPHAEFVFVGNDRIPMDDSGETFRAWFEREHGHEPWAERVVFTGMVPEDQLPGEYAAADIFCLPARFESFGLVVAEAMMHGKPVVASSIGGIPEIVADNETGILVYPNSVPSLVSALKTLLTDAALRDRMGAAGRQRYEEKFSVETMVQTAIDVYSELTRRAA